MADQSTEFHCQCCGQQLPLRPCEEGANCRDFICSKCGQTNNALFDLNAPKKIWHRVRLPDPGQQP